MFLFSSATVFREAFTDIKANGDTFCKIVYLYDDRGNEIYYFQIEGQDTLNNQKRIYDNKNNNTELYNYENGKYFLYMKFIYDSLNNEISEIEFDESGAITYKYEYENNYAKGIFKTYFTGTNGIKHLRSVSYKNGLVTKTKHYYDDSGINYGIMMSSPKGSYSVSEDDKNGNLLKLEIYNKHGKMVTSVYITYVDYP